MTRMANEYERADHDRDLAKHDAPNALDRILASMPGRLALANLVGYCDAICNSGVLGADQTPTFRRLVDDVVVKHDIPTRKHEVA
jgi:hypothetical protein